MASAEYVENSGIFVKVIIRKRENIAFTAKCHMIKNFIVLGLASLRVKRSSKNGFIFEERISTKKPLCSHPTVVESVFSMI
jgi:hypothetical protein